jgi:hypothetical protein
VVNFVQTAPGKARQIFGQARIAAEKIMAGRKNDKHKEYARYAAHCLEMVPAISDQEYRAIQREMAAEWLRLADEARRSAGRRQMQMG